MSRYLLPLAVFVAMLSLDFGAVEALASVRGKSYNVDVLKNYTESFNDFYVFENRGKFLSVRGGPGTWIQINFAGVSFWYAEFGTIVNLDIDIVGVQIGNTIAGWGVNDEEDIFLVTGTESTVPDEIEGDVSY